MSKVKVTAGLVSPRVSLLGWEMATFSLCPHPVVPLWVLNVSSDKDNSRMGRGLYPKDLILP